MYERSKDEGKTWTPITGWEMKKLLKKSVTNPEGIINRLKHGALSFYTTPWGQVRLKPRLHIKGISRLRAKWKRDAWAKFNVTMIEWAHGCRGRGAINEAEVYEALAADAARTINKLDEEL